MFLKNLTILVYFTSFLFSNESDKDLFYNYYILNGSPSSVEFDYLLKNNYESYLIHKLEINGIESEFSEDYEEFLKVYYRQYQTENTKFINAIIEPDIFYISAFLGTSNIIMGNYSYNFGETIGFHIDSPYAFKFLNKTIVLGLKSSYISLPPLNSLNWDNFRSVNMSSTYSMKFGKRIYMLSGLGITLNSNNSGSSILPLMSLDLACELPWKPLDIPFDITISGSSSWDLKNVHFGFNILFCKPYQMILEF